MPRSPLAAAALAAWALVASGARAQEPTPAPAARAGDLDPSDPDAVEARLAQERAAAAQLAARETGLLGKLAQLERQVEIEARGVRVGQQRLRAANARLAAGEVRARAVQDEVDRATDLISPRLVLRYRLGREGYLRFLLGARSVPEILRRRRLLDAWLGSDLDALSDLRLKAQSARTAREDLVRARAEVDASVAGLSGHRSALETRILQQQRALASVQKDKAAHEQAVRELERAARALDAQVAQVRAQPKAPKPPAAASPATPAAPRQPSGPIRQAKGKLLFPVDTGRVEVRFGRALDPRFKTVTLQRGIDIRSPAGTRVRAVHAGRVAHAGWFRGYGNLLILDHGEGVFSLMAHLGAIERAVGDEVDRGDELGTVGDTGSLKGTYLYFELRDGQAAVDPEKWLAKAVGPTARR